MTTTDADLIIERLDRIERQLARLAMPPPAAPATSSDDLLTVADACEILHVGRSALYRAIRERRINSFKPKGGKLRLFRRSDVFAYGMARHRATGAEIEARAAGKVLRMETHR